MADIVTLTCPNCGGKLQITPDIDRFACAHCGNEHLVKRSEGLVALQPLHATLSGLQRATDRAAAEMGLRRVNEELASIEARHGEATRTLVAARLALEQAQRRRRGLLVASVLTIFSAICCVGSLAIPFVAYATGGTEGSDALSALACVTTDLGLLVFLLAVAFVVRLLRLPRPALSSDQAQQAALSAQAEVSAAAALLQAKQAEAEKLRSVVSREEG